ncbi:MAG TPA: wax ester/triacylglycerol synthase family O-acyltransferase [Solirubrobacteraceae bacterium]|jgi:WS/DGAT/MGAT family acyltransferase
MAAQSGDTLSVIDTSFLNLEREATHMHVGGITVFAGPPLDGDALYAHVESRLHLVPRYRQKVVWPGLELGRPSWIDDPCFALDYHVRHTALPQPGDTDQLQRLAGRVFSQRLDRDKPLWEMWLVEGLADGRFAIIHKTHHALIDGMSGVDLLSLLFDITPEPREVDPPAQPWQPGPAPSALGMRAKAVAEIAGRPLAIAGRAVGAVRRPAAAAGQALEGAAGIRDLLVRPMLSPAPSTPLNTSIGPHRRVRWVSAELQDFKAIKNALGGTVNDVVLAVVTGALRGWLQQRGVRTEGLELRAMVPVSVRTEDQRNQLGNQVAAMRGPLPVYAADPVERLRIIRAGMEDLKRSKQAVGAAALTGLQEFAPPTILAQASRINFSTRLFNVIVTNVPGPQIPIYLLGRELEELIPLAFLPESHALAFAIMSVNGRISFGLLGDRDKLHDLDTVAELIEDSLAELKAAAGGGAPA